MALKTDNSHLEEKIILRINSINQINKSSISILECYAGNGVIWSEVKKRSNKTLKILQIEKEKGKNKFAICGDNLKVMKSLDLKCFDIIDLDAYGIPYAQLQECFDQKYKGFIHVTAIQSGMGSLPHEMLQKLGYTKKMIQKIPTLFSHNGIDKLKNYLYLYGVQSIEGFFIDRKNYFYFKL